MGSIYEAYKLPLEVLVSNLRAFFFSGQKQSHFFFVIPTPTGERGFDTHLLNEYITSDLTSLG